VKLIIITGQTSSGKTEKAIQVAKEYQEQNKIVWIVNCDSRQIYQDLNLTSGKIQGQWQATGWQYQQPILGEEIKFSQVEIAYFYENIPHFLIDYVELYNNFNLANYLFDFCNLIAKAKKLESKYRPDYIILCGGTCLWIKAIVERYELPILKKEFQDSFNTFKSRLETQSLERLQSQLKPYQINNHLIYKYEDAKKIIWNNSEWHNPIRLINKILTFEGQQNNWFHKQLIYPDFETTKFDIIKVDQTILEERIKHRVIERFRYGMLDELELLYLKFGSEKLNKLGLVFKEFIKYKKKLFNFDELIDQTIKVETNYSKKQLTWLNSFQSKIN
jgi:tRNA A37 N6-isopentenylltransferase MiaA